MTTPKHYLISLDDPPEQRWHQVIFDHIAPIRALHKKIEEQHSGFLSTLASGAISLASTQNKVLHKEELSAIAKQCDIPFGKLVMLQTMYELSACCTSCVMMIDNTSVHVRTMDWAMPDLKKMTITVDFMRGNEILYSAVTWAGYIGILTAIKSGMCSVSLNYRAGLGDLMENLKRLALSKWPAGYLIRYAMENNFSCKQVIDCLSTYELVAPCYFIICGTQPSECLSIIRDRDTYKWNRMNEGQLIQTNIDPEARRGTSIDLADSFDRQIKAKKIMTIVQTQEDRDHDLFERFLVDPILNDTTIYACVMIPTIGYFECKVV